MAAQAGNADVLIAGGGHVGLTLALALKEAVPALGVTLVDLAPPATSGTDTRASAIAAAGRRMLRRLGVWEEIAAAAEPILEMIITDSRTRDVARPVFLTFDGKTDDGEAFAHMVENGILNAALARAALAAGAEIIAPDRVVDFTPG